MVVQVSGKVNVTTYKKVKHSDKHYFDVNRSTLYARTLRTDLWSIVLPTNRCKRTAGYMFYSHQLSQCNTVQPVLAVTSIKHPTCLKPRSHCPGFQSRRRHGVVTGTHRDHTVATPAGTVLNRDTPGSSPGGFNCFETTGTHRAAKQRRLIPGHYCSSSGMNRISTVRPPGETVANGHELCPRWRYGDSRLGHGVSRRRAGVCQTLTGRTTVCHVSSRWMPVKLRCS